MFEIKKGISKPKHQSGVKKYPFQAMEPGDMFFVPTQNFDKTQGSVRSSARKYFKQGMKFSILRIVEKGEQGIGVWRDQ